MQQVQLASVPILGANGFMVPDQQCRPGNLSHTKRSWRSWWARKHVLFRSDNEAVVAILTTRTSKVPALMHLLRDLLLSAARWGFTFTAAHIPGVENKIADAISRFCWQDFRQLAPEAHLSPCPISQLLLDSLTPPPWNNDACISWPRVWLLPPGKHMHQVSASSSSFAAKLESFTPMACLAVQMSGLYVCLFHFWQIQFSICQLKYIYLQFAPCTLSKVFLTRCLIACGFNEC